MRVAVVFGNNGSDPRVIRTCRSLRKLGHEPHFVGWDRHPSLNSPTDAGGAPAHVLRFETRYGNSTLVAQARFTWFVIRQLVALRPDVVCAINEENAVRVLPFRGILYRRLVCDVLDSHLDVGSERPWPVRALLWLIAETARIGSQTLIATDRDRYQLFGRHRPKTKIISNYPEDPGDALSQRRLTGPIKIYVSGTLSASRGLDRLLAAVEGVENLEIVAAGWAYDRYAQETFLRHPRVRYVGSVSLDQSLALASECDAMLTYYAPICRNNILASPNKLYEAMAVGRPVIMNSEARVSQFVVANQLGYACPYDDIQGLRAVLQSLPAARVELPQFAGRVRAQFVAAHSWEKMEEILAEIYGSGPSEPVTVERRKAA